MNDAPLLGAYLEGKRRTHTWLVQTLLKVTKAKVCAIMAPGRFFFARTRGIATTLNSNCGTKARDSKPRPVPVPPAADRYRSVL